ncbi:Hpt domain-containing protein [Salipiger sp. P9]|uniref:Hpt domain-containing protein n=1 Tax=Salipiger pentaromativorans TaxID=2943193 RepID=UPI002157F5C1|nr:Hpt domain-containing protein [Salipiger pentaromativorans]MCR8549562.1 Hpt domain-containing protein [Salipiger pentaromativorans]
MIDWTRVAELRDEIGIEDFDEVVDLFLQEVATTLATLPGLAGQPAEIEAGLHFLKGSALNLGFESLAQLCQRGEDAARRGMAGSVDLDGVVRSYEQSRAEFLRDLPARLAA